MAFQYDMHLKDCAKSLRRGMTPQEQKLWHLFLKTRPEKWYRQRPMFGYIADFYCASVKLVIEVDGGQHFEKNALEYDAEREKIFAAQGIKTLRFSNDEINRRFYMVCDEIHRQTISISNHSGGIE